MSKRFDGGSIRLRGEGEFPPHLRGRSENASTSSNDNEKVPRYLQRIRARQEQKRIAAEFGSFAEQYKSLSTLVGSEAGVDFDSDKSTIAMLRAMLKMTLSMMVKAEEVFNKFPNERAAYPVIGLSSQARQIAADLRALSDRAKAGHRVVSEVVEPNLILVMQFVSGELSKLNQYAYANMSGKTKEKMLKKIDTSKRDFARYLGEIRNVSADQITKILEA